jgi:hypothetical protein
MPALQASSKASIKLHIEQHARDQVEAVPVEVGLRGNLLGELHTRAHGDVGGRKPAEIAGADEDEILPAARKVGVNGALLGTPRMLR